MSYYGGRIDGDDVCVEPGDVIECSGKLKDLLKLQEQRPELGVAMLIPIKDADVKAILRKKGWNEKQIERMVGCGAPDVGAVTDVKG